MPSAIGHAEKHARWNHTATVCVRHRLCTPPHRVRPRRKRVCKTPCPKSNWVCPTQTRVCHTHQHAAIGRKLRRGEASAGRAQHVPRCEHRVTGCIQHATKRVQHAFWSVQHSRGCAPAYRRWPQAATLRSTRCGSPRLPCIFNTSLSVSNTEPRVSNTEPSVSKTQLGVSNTDKDVCSGHTSMAPLAASYDAEKHTPGVPNTSPGVYTTPTSVSNADAGVSTT